MHFYMYIIVYILQKSRKNSTLFFNDNSSLSQITKLFENQKNSSLLFLDFKIIIQC